MMKKIVTFAATLALAFTVAAPAQAGDRGDKIGAFIGGVILGAVVSDSNRDRECYDCRDYRRGRDWYEPRGRYDYPDTRYRNRGYRTYRECYTVWTTEFDRYGRRFRRAETVCE